MRKGRRNKTRFRQFTSRIAKSHLVDTTRIPGFQPGRHHETAKYLVHNTRYADFAEVRCFTCGTGCLPINLLFRLTRFCIGHFTTVNLERKLRETTCLSGAPTQTGDTEKRACNRRTTREDTTEKYSIVTHIRKTIIMNNAS